MKTRLTALDGLRGFAALAVALSHIDNQLILQGTGPIFTSIFRSFSAGPTAVQILFVLTGFLMAYLYPTIAKPFEFIQKRYTRIFPTLITAVFFFWFLRILPMMGGWPAQIVLFLVVALIIRYLWKVVRQFNNSGKLGKFIFYLFIVLQGFIVLGTIYVLPRLTLRFADTAFFKPVITLLANLTLTKPFSTYTVTLNSVFWSLTPEVIFYLLYPFVGISIIFAARRWGWFAGLLLVLAGVKIVFDIDHALVFQEGLLAINVARATGFISGVVVGTIYQQQSNIWIMTEKMFRKTWVGVLVSILFIGMLWEDPFLKDAGNAAMYNNFYLIASLIISLIIVSALIPGSVIHKIFSHKFFVFLGFISYALYVTHIQAIFWAMQMLSIVKNNMPLGWYVVSLIVLGGGLSILLAWVLYVLVDSLYFAYRHKIPGETVIKKGIKKSAVLTAPSFKFVLYSMLLYALIMVAIYAGKYSPSLLIFRHNSAIHNKNASEDKSLLSGKVTFPFTAQTDNLSIVAVKMRYGGNATETHRKIKIPAELEFKLFDKNGAMIFQSKNTAYQVEGQPDFAFGFPTIPNSQGKSYNAELTLLHGTHNDQVIVAVGHENLISFYKEPKSIATPFIIAWNRLLFTLSSQAGLFALLLVPFVLLLSLKKPSGFSYKLAEKHTDKKEKKKTN